MLTLEERIYCIQCYGIGDSSFPVVIRKFSEKFPHTVLTQSTASRLVKKFLETGSVLNIKKQKKTYDEDDAATLLVSDSIRQAPKKSLRKRSDELGVSKSLVQKICKSNKIYPFKAKFLQRLEDGDDAKRLTFCLALGEKIINNPQFHKSIIFSDESLFTTNGVASSQNTRFWSQENPNFRITNKRQYFKKVNVWCAVSYDYGVIGPYFIEGKLNQHRYLNILQWFLRQVPGVQNNSYFQHDGCPAHSTRMVVEWLNQTFGNRWIGRSTHDLEGIQDLIQWPARSPDLTVMDFYFWGKVKQKVYAELLPNDSDFLKNRIRAAINSITIDEIRRSFSEFRTRIELCAQKGGGLIE